MSPNPRCEWEVQEKLGGSIHYQVDILWGSSKVDGLKCKPFTDPTNMDQLKKYHV